MKMLITLMMFLAVAASGAEKAPSAPSDSEITTGLVGTWIDAPSDHATTHGKTIYYADGHGVAFVWPAGQPESSAVRIETRWSVTNQVLIMKSVASSDAQKIPIGVELRDRIVSISADKFEFTPENYGDADKKQYTRIRVKAGT